VVDETAAAARITAPKHFLFNMAFPSAATRIGMIAMTPGHDQTISVADAAATYLYRILQIDVRS
jgi:hypothetical protein